MDKNQVDVEKSSWLRVTTQTFVIYIVFAFLGSLTGRQIIIGKMNFASYGTFNPQAAG